MFATSYDREKSLYYLGPILPGMLCPGMYAPESDFEKVSRWFDKDGYELKRLYVIGRTAIAGVRVYAAVVRNRETGWYTIWKVNDLSYHTYDREIRAKGLVREEYSFCGPNRVWGRMDGGYWRLSWACFDAIWFAGNYAASGTAREYTFLPIPQDKSAKAVESAVREVARRIKTFKNIGPWGNIERIEVCRCPSTFALNEMGTGLTIDITVVASNKVRVQIYAETDYEDLATIRSVGERNAIVDESAVTVLDLLIALRNVKVFKMHRSEPKFCEDDY